MGFFKCGCFCTCKVLLQLALISIVLSPLLVGGSACSGKRNAYDIRLNTTMSGSDLGKPICLGRTVATYVNCSLACSLDCNCAGFVIDNDEFSNASCCYMKTTIGDQIRNSNVDLHIRQNLSQLPPPSPLHSPDSVNLALNKSTKQSSGFSLNGVSFTSSLAVDGNTTRVLYGFSCSHTRQESKPWWMVDLGTTTTVGVVELFNRITFKYRLSNVQVWVGNDSRSYSGTGSTQCDPTNLYNDAISDGFPFTKTCSIDGRFVWVTLPFEDQILTLCEVRVYSVDKKDSSRSLIFGIIGGVSAAVFITILLLLFCYCYVRKRSDVVSAQDIETASPSYVPLEKHSELRIPLSKILPATNYFSSQNFLGKGGHGVVYKGVVENGEVWAVKRAVESKQNLSRFMQEVNFISKMSHTNIVKLLGFCTERDEQILVYEFMEKGSLRNFVPNLNGEPLSFEQRVGIAIDIAEGLRYFHHFAGSPVIHRDIKTDNILLDHRFKAKIADFGLLKDNSEDDGFRMYKTKVVGTPGYIDPNYFKSYSVSSKSDVYSFGVVLFELIAGKHALVVDTTAAKDDPTLDTLVHWIRPRLKNIISIIDPQLGENYHPRAMQKLIRLAAICTDKSPKSRPTMEIVVQLLARIRNIMLSIEDVELKSDDEWEDSDDSSNASEISGAMGTSYSDTVFITPV